MKEHVTTLEIDGAALRHNLRFFKEKVPSQTRIMVVVKAFAYGSSAVEIAKFLEKDVAYFAVAYTDEGIALREAGITIPILVLHPQIRNLQKIVEYRLEPNMYSEKILEAFLALADSSSLLRYPIHIKFNTGLNRIGFSYTDIPVVLRLTQESSHVKIQSVFSHLAASEDLNERDFTTHQIRMFTRIAEDLCAPLEEKPFLHLLNTSGIINYAGVASFDMVRLGLGLYGFANSDRETKQLQNVFCVTSIISQLFLIQTGESVGYNRSFVATQPTKSATIPIGHADGISRKLGNGKGYVLINNQKARIIGNVCMDMIMVDVSAIECAEGDEVIVFNSQEMVEEIARTTGTISYEVLTSLSQRMKRVFKH